MAKTFTVMKASVGNLVQDTSTALATLIGGWLNDGYRDVWRRCLWSSSINNNYSFTTVAAGSATSCTASASTDAFTATAHGLLNGDMIYIGGTTVPTGVTASTLYYVVNKTTDTFQISTVKDGSAVDLTSTGTSVTFTFTARDTFDLPTDFEDELFVSNLNDGDILTRSSEGLWWKERYPAYSSKRIEPGTFPKRYVILREQRNSTNVGFGVIQLDPPSNVAKMIGMPYKRKCNNLIAVSGTCTTDTAYKVIASAETFITDGVQAGHILKNTSDTTYGRVTSVDSETQLTMDWDICDGGDETFEIYTYPEIQDIEEILEMYAASQAEAYKRQYQKAMYWGNRYETLLARRIGQERSKINQSYQWIPEQRDSYNVMPFTGWESYDSLT